MRRSSARRGRSPTRQPCSKRSRCFDCDCKSDCDCSPVATLVQPRISAASQAGAYVAALCDWDALLQSQADKTDILVQFHPDKVLSFWTIPFPILNHFSSRIPVPVRPLPQLIGWRHFRASVTIDSPSLTPPRQATQAFCVGSW